MKQKSFKDLSTTKPSKEATFKALKILKIKEKECPSGVVKDEDNEDSADDEVLAYLTRKYNKGARKIKDTISLKCFICEKARHFA